MPPSLDLHMMFTVCDRLSHRFECLHKRMLLFTPQFKHPLRVCTLPALSLLFIWVSRVRRSLPQLTLHSDMMDMYTLYIVKVGRIFTLVSVSMYPLSLSHTEVFLFLPTPTEVTMNLKFFPNAFLGTLKYHSWLHCHNKILQNRCLKQQKCVFS